MSQEFSLRALSMRREMISFPYFYFYGAYYYATIVIFCFSHLMIVFFISLCIGHGPFELTFHNL